MKLLVFSDTHGVPLFMQEALQQHRTADAVIFLGDGMRNIPEMQALFPEMAFYAVRGNCDFDGGPDKLVLDLDGARIFCTHGHLYNVKSGLYSVVCAAREEKANLLLFGHTHQSLELYEDGLHIMNPGAISGYPFSYGIVEISPAGILTNIIHRK